MAKARINVRLRTELWEAVDAYARRHDIDKTAVIERALEALLGQRNGNGRPLSPKLRDGIAPRPKGK